GQQNQPVALGDQPEQLGQNRRDLHERNELGDGGDLALDRNRGIEQHLAERRMFGEEVGELGQLLFDLFQVRALFDGDVEQRARVACGGSFIRHLRELAKSFTSRTLYHWVTSRDKPRLAV